MWQNENIEQLNLSEEYSKVIKNAKKGKDSILYLYLQLFFSGILIVSAFMLKGGNTSTFEYAKQGYSDFFEKESYIESTFSYNTFMEKIKNEIIIRYSKLIEVFNSLDAKGKTDEKPDNVSLEKCYLNERGYTPVKGYISSGFGFRKDPFNPKNTDFHTGTDIAAPKGTFISSAFNGTVIDAGYSKAAGNYIKIQSDSIVTMYAHCQFIFVKKDEKVLAGQIIATVGQTGYATGPHLHFEFSYDGIKYNPLYVINI